MKHLNGHMMCAIDTETTGTNPQKHDVIQISIIPLTHQLTPREDIQTFDIKMKPGRPENIDWDAIRVTKVSINALTYSGMDPICACDLLDEWFKRLKLPEGKKIVPLGCNYSFDLAFIMSWYGVENYNARFHGHYRDVMQLCLYHNDIADEHADQIPHPKLGLKDIARDLNVEMDSHRAHDSCYDAYITSLCYKEKLRRMLMMPY